MDFVYSLFFGAGASAFIYAKLGRRIGYGNPRSVFGIVALVFVITTIVFFTIFSLLPHHK